MDPNYTITAPEPSEPVEVFPCFAINVDEYSVFTGYLVMFVTPTAGFVLGSRDGRDVGHSWTETQKSVYKNSRRWSILAKGTKINLDITV